MAVAPVKEKIPSITGIRGIAALTVVLYHCGSCYNNATLVRLFPGAYAVNIFFVLSGFLITRLLLEEQNRTGTIDLKNFYVRRSRRIFPAFYAFLFVRTVICPAMPLVALLSVVFYWSNYQAAFYGIPSLRDLVHTWSLAAEEQFYLLWPLIFALFIHRRQQLIGWVMAAIVLAQVGRLFLPLDYAGYALETRCDGVLLGALLAIRPPKLPRWALHPFFAFAAAAVTVVANVDSPWLFRYGMTLTAWVGAFLVLQASQSRWRILNNPIAEYFGNMSYSIYLYNYLAISLVETWHPRSFALGVVVTLVIVTAAASASYHFIEKPFRARPAVADPGPIVSSAVAA